MVHSYMLLIIMVNITWTHEYKPLASVFFFLVGLIYNNHLEHHSTEYAVSKWANLPVYIYIYIYLHTHIYIYIYI